MVSMHTKKIAFFILEICFRIDHLLGRNIIENLTVLRFSNLVFQPLWNRTYVRNIQVTIILINELSPVVLRNTFSHEGIFTVRWTCLQIILSEDLAVQMQGR